MLDITNLKEQNVRKIINGVSVITATISISVFWVSFILNVHGVLKLGMVLSLKILDLIQRKLGFEIWLHDLNFYLERFKTWVWYLIWYLPVTGSLHARVDVGLSGVVPLQAVNRFSMHLMKMATDCLSAVVASSRFSASVAKNQHFRPCRKTKRWIKNDWHLLELGEIELSAPAVGVKIGVFCMSRLVCLCIEDTVQTSIVSRFMGRFWCGFQHFFHNVLLFQMRYILLIFFARWRHIFREIAVKNCEKSKNRRKSLCAPLRVDSWRISKKFHRSSLQVDVQTCDVMWLAYIQNFPHDAIYRVRQNKVAP